ncbi:MAG: TetR/AcrR family transcriptional regulator [Gemmatimonadota bacterium]|jgi:AcrR family transcriptional regulator
MESLSTRRAQARDEQRRQTSEDILDAALQLFITDGYGAVTMRGIAARVGCSPGNLYHYFPGKNDIFLALRDQGFERFREYQARTREVADPVGRMRAHAAAYLRFAMEQPRHYELMFLMPAVEPESIPADMVDRSRRSLDMLRSDLRACMEEGSMQKWDIDVAAIGIWSQLHGFASLLLRRRLTLHSSLPDDRLADELVEFMFAHIPLTSKEEGS